MRRMEYQIIGSDSKGRKVMKDALNVPEAAFMALCFVWLILREGLSDMKKFFF